MKKREREAEIGRVVAKLYIRHLHFWIEQKYTPRNVRP